MTNNNINKPSNNKRKKKQEMNSRMKEEAMWDDYFSVDPAVKRLMEEIEKNERLQSKLFLDLKQTESILIRLHNQIKQTKEYGNKLQSKLESKKLQMRQAFKELATSYHCPVDLSFCPISVLSDELFLLIFKYLQASTLAMLSSVSKRFLRVSGDNSLWRPLFLDAWPRKDMFQDKPWSSSSRVMGRDITYQLPAPYTLWKNYYLDRKSVIVRHCKGNVHHLPGVSKIGTRQDIRNSIGTALEELAIEQLKKGDTKTFDILFIMSLEMYRDTPQESFLNSIYCYTYEDWGDAMATKAILKGTEEAVVLTKQAIQKYQVAIEEHKETFLDTYILFFSHEHIEGTQVYKVHDVFNFLNSIHEALSKKEGDFSLTLQSFISLFSNSSAKNALSFVKEHLEVVSRDELKKEQQELGESAIVIEIPSFASNLDLLTLPSHEDTLCHFKNTFYSFDKIKLNERSPPVFSFLSPTHADENGSGKDNGTVEREHQVKMSFPSLSTNEDNIIATEMQSKCRLEDLSFCNKKSKTSKPKRVGYTSAIRDLSCFRDGYSMTIQRVNLGQDPAKKALKKYVLLLFKKALMIKRYASLIASLNTNRDKVKENILKAVQLCQQALLFLVFCDDSTFITEILCPCCGGEESELFTIQVVKLQAILYRILAALHSPGFGKGDERTKESRDNKKEMQKYLSLSEAKFLRILARTPFHHFCIFELARLNALGEQEEKCRSCLEVYVTLPTKNNAVHLDFADFDLYRHTSWFKMLWRRVKKTLQDWVGGTNPDQERSVPQASKDVMRKRVIVRAKRNKRKKPRGVK